MGLSWDMKVQLCWHTLAGQLAAASHSCCEWLCKVSDAALEHDLRPAECDKLGLSTLKVAGEGCLLSSDSCGCTALAYMLLVGGAEGRWHRLVGTVCNWTTLSALARNLMPAFSRSGLAPVSPWLRCCGLAILQPSIAPCWRFYSKQLLCYGGQAHAAHPAATFVLT